MATIVRLGFGFTRNILQLSNVGFIWPALEKSTCIDVIDSFTSELVEKRAQKWEKLRRNWSIDSAISSPFGYGAKILAKSVMNDLESIKSNDIVLDIRQLTRPQLENLLLATLEAKNVKDFIYLIKECSAWRILPGDKVLIECVKYLSSLGETNHIDALADICKNVNKHNVFTPFKGMSLWRSGNSQMALSTLAEGYTSCSDENGRKLIRAAFKIISDETTDCKSEAVLINLLQIATNIYDTHKDIYVLACVWKNCFVSDWFCDQKLASKIFEEFNELRSLVFNRSSSLCVGFLQKNNVDSVHRLIELFLLYDNKEACRNCLSSLFDYQYYKKNLRACTAVVKNSAELDLPLSEMQNEKFLQLLLNQPATRLKHPINCKFEYKF